MSVAVAHGQRLLASTLYCMSWTKPDELDEARPELAAQGEACCDSVTRGAAFLDGKVFINTLDGNTVAVDAQTGKERWRKQLADYHIGEVINMAPLAVKGKILVGNSGSQFG